MKEFEKAIKKYGPKIDRINAKMDLLKRFLFRARVAS
jgi:hypothetical protein